MSLKVAIHYTHRESVGHGARVFKISRALKEHFKEKVDILILQGGIPQPFLRPKGIKICDLPFPLASRSWLYPHARRAVDVEKIKARLKFMKDAVVSFKPDIFITESFPFDEREEEGRYEIYPLVRYLKERFPQIVVYSSVGYPIFGLEQKARGDLLRYSQLYDAILVHTPLDLDVNYIQRTLGSDLERDPYLKILGELKQKLIFTGYVVERKKSIDEFKSSSGLKDSKLIVISRGGGFIYPALISKSILAKRHLQSHNFFFLVSAGPFSTADEMKLFKKLKSKFNNVRLVEYIPNFVDYLSAADVSIGMAGYNTSTEILWLRKKAILVPNIRTDRVEQIYRARMLQDLIGASVLDYDSLTPAEIASEIRYQIEKTDKERLSKVKDEWFDGLENIVRFIEERFIR